MASGESSPNDTERKPTFLDYLDSPSDIKLYATTRQKLEGLINSHQFHISVIILVVLDVFLVVAELLVDIHKLELKLEKKFDDGHYLVVISHFLRYFSITILAVFLVEIILKIYVLHFRFFFHKLEVLDAIVVIVSLVVETVMMNAPPFVGFIIGLRLWRVIRILNGIVASVNIKADNRLLKERMLKESCEQQLAETKDYYKQLEVEIKSLRGLLAKNGISTGLPSSVVRPPSPAFLQAS